MMQIVYFSQKSQFIAELDSQMKDLVFVAPSPAKADGLRSLLTNSQADVITIAKFTANLVESLWDFENRPVIKRKADLLLIFGILKNKYLPDLGFEEFTQAYNLFSDLRSFTLNQEALVSVMDEQPESIQKAVNLFWQLLSITGFHDEHGAYQKITEALRSSEEIESLKKTFVFWGFQHLNGQQVDLIKALAIRYQVIIPFPLDLKDSLKRSDWLSWVIDSQTTEKILPPIIKEAQGELCEINSREIASTLKDIIKDHDQVILGVSKLSPLHLDIIPSGKVKYKIPHQILSSELAELAASLKEEFRSGTDFKILEKNITDRQKIFINLKSKNFKSYKALQLYQEALAVIQELSDENFKVDHFFLKLLREVVNLNQPRTSFVPVSPHDLTVDLYDMSSLDDVDRKRRIYLCIDDRFEDIQGLGQNYTEAIQKALSSLGPLKRNELELQFKKWEFKNLFIQGNVTVLMSEMTLKHSLVWKKLFSEIELFKQKDKVVKADRKLLDHLLVSGDKKFNGSFSASKFQTFIDCPRKFYFSYVDQIFPKIMLIKDFDPMTAGSISHKIIEVFFAEKLQIEDIPKLTKRIMQEYISLGKLQISKETYLQRELIFNHRAQNGILFLKDLETVLGLEIKWTIESDFNFTDDYKITGKIDCLGETPHLTILLDFKSTKGGASPYSEVESLESLQLWTYAYAASKSIPDLKSKSILMGFVSLDKSSDSNLLTNDAEVLDKLKASKICKQKLFSADFSEIFTEAIKKMSSLAVSISSEEHFWAKPRKNKVCHFCELSKVCVKSEVSP